MDVFKTVLFLFLSSAFVCGEHRMNPESLIPTMNNTQEYRIEPITAEDEEEAMELFRKFFYMDEPMNKAVDLCGVNENCTEVEGYCRKSLSEGLSFKAVDSTGRIVGAMASGVRPLKEVPPNDTRTEWENCKNQKFKKILYVILQREENIRLAEKYPTIDNLVEIFAVATDRKWRRRGILNALVARTEAEVRKHYKLLRVDTSSYYSAKSAERHGFTCIYRVKYSDIKLNGQPVIVPEAPHLEDRVYIKELFSS